VKVYKRHLFLTNLQNCNEAIVEYYILFLVINPLKTKRD